MTLSLLAVGVQREVEWDMQHNVASTSSSGRHYLPRKPARGVATKPTVGFGSGAPRMNRIDTGLHKSQSQSGTTVAAGRAKNVIRTKPAPKVRAELLWLVEQKVLIM